MTVASVGWTPKVVRTGGISGPLHDEWRLGVRLESEVPFRALAYLDFAGARRYSTRWGHRSGTSIELDVVFMPWDWEASDEVLIRAEEAVRVQSRELKNDPVAATEVRIAKGRSGSTAVPLTVLAIPSVGVEVGVLAVAATETRARHAAWRVRDEHANGLGSFALLATTRSRGEVPLDGAL